MWLAQAGPTVAATILLTRTEIGRWRRSLGGVGAGEQKGTQLDLIDQGEAQAFATGEGIVPQTPPSRVPTEIGTIRKWGFERDGAVHPKMQGAMPPPLPSSAVTPGKEEALGIPKTGLWGKLRRDRGLL
jgi:hypothetical protein